MEPSDSGGLETKLEFAVRPKSYILGVSCTLPIGILPSVFLHFVLSVCLTLCLTVSGMSYNAFVPFLAGWRHMLGGMS